MPLIALFSMDESSSIAKFWKSLSRREETGEHGIQRFACSDLQIIDLQPAASSSCLFQEVIECLKVTFPKRGWIAIQCGLDFQSFEPSCSGEVEIHFVIVQHVNQRHVMTASPQDSQAFLQLFHTQQI